MHRKYDVIKLRVNLTLWYAKCIPLLTGQISNDWKTINSWLQIPTHCLQLTEHGYFERAYYRSMQKIHNKTGIKTKPCENLWNRICYLVLKW